jgi:NADPH-dependent 2,4-dienoyl-CoA reductase/sulfur reductase-like enzyme/rhodanese-related sulfurtransferase
MKTIIIGGVAVGMSAATRLRRIQEDAQITIYEMGENVSYANCGLPYYLSGTIKERSALLLQTPESLNRRFNLDVKVLHKVESINAAAKTVQVKNLATGEIFEDNYDKLVIATGGRPFQPPTPGIENTLTLWDVSDVDRMKAAAEASKTKTAVVIGGGFIGIEVAENLKHAGFDVHILERAPQLLINMEVELVEIFQQNLEKNGIKLHLAREAKEITKDSVILGDGITISTDLVVSAIGVAPQTWLAADAGLTIGKTGGIWVDDQLCTSDPNIYAAGDAAEKTSELTGMATRIPLANLANRHGRLIADAIGGLDVKVRRSIGTAIIGAFGMAISSTGLGPKQLTAAGIDFSVIHLHPGSHAGYYPGSMRISMLVTFEKKTGKILGAQAVGEDGADKRIDVISTAIYAGLTIDDLMNLELAYSPQYGSAKDAVNQAGYVGNNVFSGKTPTFQWHELEAEVAKPNTVLVDVRTASENQAGTTPSSIHISVDDLRNRIDELKGKRVLVHCQVGQRGHTATQILRGHGIEALNLDGGYLTWRAGQDATERN